MHPSLRREMNGPTLRVLGGFELARADGQVLELPSRKARMLLAFVALNAPRPVSRERLAGLLWGDGGDRQALHSLRQCLLELRRLGERAGGDLLHSDREAVALALPPGCVDALTVQRLAHEATPGSLRAATEMCSGMVLPEAEAGLEDFDTWLAGERARFARIAANVFSRLTAMCEAQGDWGGVGSAAERWLTFDPACEEAHRALMRAHISTGRRSDALRQYRNCAEAVRRHLDAEPEEETKALLRRIRNSDGAVPPAAMVGNVREPETRAVPARPSLAVLPFGILEGPAEGGGLADALAHDILLRLARLRSLFVISHGSSFRFRDASADPRTIGRTLGVRYLVTGTVRTQYGRLRLTVELVEAETEAVVWSDVLDRRLDDVFAIQDELTARVAASLEAEIETAEIRRALMRQPASLDAWGAYHRGLWHMFRFTRDDNETARGFFQQAVGLDPLCARAHAGLSFTHFQDAFLHRTADHAVETDRAYRFAEQSVALDERDPTAHWVLGRALWLLKRQEDAVEELNLAVDFNPNFALGHYTIAFVQAQGGDTPTALRAVDLAQRLSPIDPLLFGMLGVRALACLNLGEYAQAAVWGERAAGRPNAHVHIHAIAAFCDALADRQDEARAYAHRIRQTTPSYRCADFLLAFRTLRPSVADLIRRTGPRIGIPP
ncbi:BTAD domain-containing putative transcriptional regulator [Skermanella aerolata]|uniref:BTAD domain-containing putative transcriptional regulator n=1 Tax=Skermanella aerolata TaxID=393310 RepID=UPI0011BDFA0F|nr:BTAD domain-containing putative transcriptional regulator [Skermanella aerolata]